MSYPRPEEREAAFHAKLDELFSQPVAVSSMEDLVDALRLQYYHLYGALLPEKEVIPVPGARGRRIRPIGSVEE